MNAKRKNNVKVGLIRGNSVSKSTKPDVELYKRQVAEGRMRESGIRKGLVASRVDYPVVLKYGSGHLRLSPRGSMVVGDCEKLQSPLPKGIYLKKMYDEKKDEKNE